LLNARKRIVCEDNLELEEILKLINFTLPNQNPAIQIRNLLGFNQFVNETKPEAVSYLNNIDIYFDNVLFDFYLNKTLVTRDTCKKENFYGKQINYFFPMKNVYFNNDASYSYSRPTCPYVFLNAELINVGFFQITNSLIFKNQLEFINID